MSLIFTCERCVAFFVFWCQKVDIMNLFLQQACCFQDPNVNKHGEFSGIYICKFWYFNSFCWTKLSLFLCCSHLSLI